MSSRARISRSSRSIVSASASSSRDRILTKMQKTMDHQMGEMVINEALALFGGFARR